jgi:alkanesulfonate monooxygenase SsuD/methylene tetrahydromethanopterin reductase-like flavin-dependent oxidoreductase (luciferase family)
MNFSTTGSIVFVSARLPSNAETMSGNPSCPVSVAPGVSAGQHSGAGRPLVLVGGEGERRTLPAAARYADAINWQVGVKGFVRKSQVLRELCEDIGRDPDTVRLTHAPNFQLFESERDFARWRQDERRGMSSEEVYAYIRNRGAMYGTASAIEETIEEFTAAGCRGFMVFCNSAPESSGLQQLASLSPVMRALVQTVR